MTHCDITGNILFQVGETGVVVEAVGAGVLEEAVVVVDLQEDVVGEVVVEEEVSFDLI